VSGAGAVTTHRIADFAHPRLPWPVRLVNALLRPLATNVVRLDEAGLLATAQRTTGLRDFGDERFREPLHALLHALETEACLSPLGRFMARQTVLQLLTTRLRVQDLTTRHPEIREQRIARPIVVSGLPRTGTTHLHNLISRDPDLRSLPYWEALEPLLRGDGRPVPGQPDPRVARCAQALRFVAYVMPLFPLMHEMDAQLPHEEIQLLAVEFSTMLFEASYHVPSYRAWYAGHDQTPAYGTLKLLLQVLQWTCGGTRWVLKSPQHLEQIGPLLGTFPDVTFVQTHRDPVAVTASLCTMTTYGLRMQSDRIDPVARGRYWATRVEELLRASVRDRPLVPAAQVFDVRFHEFMADDVAMVERVYAAAGQPMTDRARAAARAFMDANPRRKLGRVEYRLEDFGLDPIERRRALRFYQERFGVPDE
jgi:hypothetical protein